MFHRLCWGCHRLSTKKLLVCGQCKLLSYCGTKCQRKGWKGKNGHKHKCKYYKTIYDHDPQKYEDIKHYMSFIEQVITRHTQRLNHFDVPVDDLSPIATTITSFLIYPLDIRLISTNTFKNTCNPWFFEPNHQLYALFAASQDVDQEDEYSFDDSDPFFKNPLLCDQVFGVYADINFDSSQGMFWRRVDIESLTTPEKEMDRIVYKRVPPQMNASMPTDTLYVEMNQEKTLFALHFMWGVVAVKPPYHSDVQLIATGMQVKLWRQQNDIFLFGTNDTGIALCKIVKRMVSDDYKYVAEPIIVLTDKDCQRMKIRYLTNIKPIAYINGGIFLSAQSFTDTTPSAEAYITCWYINKDKNIFDYIANPVEFEKRSYIRPWDAPHYYTKNGTFIWLVSVGEEQCGEFWQIELDFDQKRMVVIQKDKTVPGRVFAFGNQEDCAQIAVKTKLHQFCIYQMK
eukprot:204973_1